MAQPAKNNNLFAAKKAKNDEFYTMFNDINNEMLAYHDFDQDVFRDKVILLPCDDPEWSNFTKYFALNFESMGIKKLISTSYAPASNPAVTEHAPSEKEIESPRYDPVKSQENGRIFILDRDINKDGKIDIHDIEWDYLDGDGDFRSDEVTALRDEADMVITNPPFSLYREFVAWLIEGEVEYSIIGNKNSVTYKEIFPLIKCNKMWVGRGFSQGNAYFRIPKSLSREYAEGVYDEETSVVHFRNVDWFTNIEHGRRHEFLELMTMEDNIKYCRRKVVRENGYQKYDNYDAIEVSFTVAIPSDYAGVMGVPISFLDKYNPEQFEILGITKTWDDGAGLKKKIYPTQTQVSKNGTTSSVGKLNDGAAIPHDAPPENTTYYEVDGQIFTQQYARILIRHRRPDTKEV